MNRIGRLNIVLKRAPLTRLTIRSTTIGNSSTVVVKTSKFANDKDNFVSNSGTSFLVGISAKHSVGMLLC